MIKSLTHDICYLVRKVRTIYRLKFGRLKTNVTSHSSEYKEINTIASYLGESKKRFDALRCGADNRERVCGTRSY